MSIENLDLRSRAMSPEEVVAHVRSHDRVFIHGASATPTPLVEALASRVDLDGVRLYHLHLAGNVPFVAPEHEARFRSISFFTGAGMRKPIEEGRAGFFPVFLSLQTGVFAACLVPPGPPRVSPR